MTPNQDNNWLVDLEFPSGETVLCHAVVRAGNALKSESNQPYSVFGKLSGSDEWILIDFGAKGEYSAILCSLPYGIKEVNYTKELKTIENFGKRLWAIGVKPRISNEQAAQLNRSASTWIDPRKAEQQEFERRAAELPRKISITTPRKGIPFPVFKYHPDPLATGSITEGKHVCCVCNTKVGYRFDGPIYSPIEPDGAICPWCISDGSAAEMFDGVFLDPEGIVDKLDKPVVEELTKRTPSFSTWQETSWIVHCGDAAAYLGDSLDLLEGAPATFWTHVREFIGLSSDDFEVYKRGIFKKDFPIYIFKCLHCDELLGYSDHT